MDESRWESVEFLSFLTGERKYQLPEGDALDRLKLYSEQALKTSLQDCVVGRMDDITDQELSPVLHDTVTLHALTTMTNVERSRFSKPK